MDGQRDSSSIGAAALGDVPVEAVLHDLAAVLRESSDIVLKCERNVLLTPSIVRYLTGRFRQLAASSASSSVVDNADVDFLWEFLQKVPSVKLLGNSHRPQAQRVSLHVFRSLTHLTLRKVNASDVSGLQGLRGQLQSLTCERSIPSLKSVLVRCGADEAAPFMWPKLVHIDFSYNGFKELDDSLRFASSLTKVSLSHNQVSQTQEFLQPLSDVVMLNLAFNGLRHIPTLSSRAGRLHLKTLILRSNNLDNLHGLDQLRVLQDLDLSDNCLMTHHCLTPLAELVNLVSLTLSGNPLAYQTNHRLLTCHHISPHVNSNAVVLDARRLSAQEIQHIPRVGPYGLGMPPTTPEISSMSRGPSPLGASSTSTSEVTSGESPMMPVRVSKQKRRSRTRAPAIEDSPADSAADAAKASSAGAPRNLRFESTIKLSQYQILKEQMGSDYLQQLDLPNNSSARNRSSSNESGSTMPASTDGSQVNLADDLPLSSTPLDSHDLFEALSIPDASPVKPVKRVKQLDGEIPFTRNESDLSDMEQEEVDSNSFLVTIQDSDDEGESLKQQRFVSLTDKGFLQERDYKAEVVEMLALACLLRASLTPTHHKSSSGSGSGLECDQQYTLHLEFDYSRRDRRQRDYILDSYEHGQAMLSTLLPIIETNRAAASVQTMLECLQCSAVFRGNLPSNPRSPIAAEMDNERGGSEQRCPKCNGDMVVSVENKHTTKDPLQPHHIEQALRSGRSSANTTPQDSATVTLQTMVSIATPDGGSLENSLVASSSSIMVLGPHSEARRSLMSSSMLRDPDPRPGYSPKPMLEVEKSGSDSNLSSGADMPDDALLTPMAGSVGTAGLQWSPCSPSNTVSARDQLARQPVALSNSNGAHPGACDSLVLSDGGDTIDGGGCASMSDISTPHAVSPAAPASPSSPVSPAAPKAADNSFASFLTRYSVRQNGSSSNSPVAAAVAAAAAMSGSEAERPVVGIWQEHSLDEDENDASTAHSGEVKSWIVATPELSASPSKSPDDKSPKLSATASLHGSQQLSGSPLSTRHTPSLPSNSAPVTDSAYSGNGSLSARHSPVHIVASSPTLCYSPDDCTFTSHDLQLHLQLQVFSNDETPCCVLRASTLQSGTREPTEKFLVVSNTTCYFCDLEPKQRISPSAWPVCSRKIPLSAVCFVEVGLGYQTLRIEFDEPNPCFTFVIGDEARCQDFLGTFTDSLLARLKSCRHAFRGVFYTNFISLHRFRQEILKVSSMDLNHVAYDILSRHCLCKTSSLVAVDHQDASGVLTVCMAGNQLVDLILDLKLETDRRAAVHLCHLLLREGLLFAEGDPASRNAFADKPSPCYGFSPQPSSMSQWSRQTWEVEAVVAARFTQSGHASHQAVEFAVVGKTAHIVQRDYNLPLPRLPCGATTSTSASPFFTAVTSRSIESISSLVLYKDFPQALGIEFFDEDVSEECDDSSWQLECHSPASVRALCMTLSKVWEKEFHISLQPDVRPGAPGGKYEATGI